MPMKVLLPIDNSRHTTFLLNWMIQLPFREAPTVTVLHVKEDRVLPEPFLPPVLAMELQEEMDRRAEAARKMVDHIAQRLQEHGHTVQIRLERGGAPQKILDVVREESPDLILIGAHGVSQVPGFLLGSTAQKVVTYAPCSVLVVKKKVRGIRRILFAMDGSKHAYQAVETVTRWFQPEGIQCTVLHVWPPPVKSPPKDSRLGEEVLQTLQQAGFAARRTAVCGHPAEQIVAQATRSRTDLVVVGSRGLTGFRRLLLGGVSHKVVKYTPSSVLVVRSAGRKG